MGMPAIAWKSELLQDNIVRVAYTGRGASASDGNSDGQRMCEGIDEILKSQKPTALVVDLSELEYQFGDWIGSVLLAWISHQ